MSEADARIVVGRVFAGRMAASMAGSLAFDRSEAYCLALLPEPAAVMGARGVEVDVKFNLIDTVVSREADGIVALKQVTMAEEYLADHFPTFPVLPGVMMLEAMVQAARAMLADRGDERLVLGEVRAMKYGTFVRPGDTLSVEVALSKALADGSFACRGTATVYRAERGIAATAAGDDEMTGVSGGETAVSGRFTMRSIRHETPGTSGLQGSMAN